jgi:DNA-binding transcriptional LysR family regulator
VFESGLSETIREMVLRHMGMAWLPESMVAEELVNQQIIHCWPENADLICEIPLWYGRILTINAPSCRDAGRSCCVFD